MNRPLRTACLLTTLIAALPLSGCFISTSDNKVTIENAIRYSGPDVSKNVDYTSGQAVRITSDNGDVHVESGAVSQIQITFSPFTLDSKDAKDRATFQLENNLHLSIGGSGEIDIQVSRSGTYSSGLGADIHVVLPTSFNGDFEVKQNNGEVHVDLGAAAPHATTVTSANGSINVAGARGKLDVSTKNGAVSVGVAAWSTENGGVKTDNGDISFTLPASTSGKMTAVANGGQVTEMGLPASWQMAGQGNSKSYTMGDGKGGQVDLATQLGDISIVAAAN